MTSPQLPDYPAVKAYLYGLKYHGAKYGIERMQRLSESLSHPERSYPVIHVAGTNGKGSVCAMLEAVLRAHGLKTGLFTSPHLIRQGERIQVDRTILTEDKIVDYTRELQRHAEAIAARDPDDHPSFFEFMTGMAFLHFAREKVDVAVIETGLGGRLDATNVVRPELSVITSIGLDHCEILGRTHAAIAREKAGILKPGVPAVLGLLPAEAEGEIRRIAAERGCPVTGYGEIYGPGKPPPPPTNLSGGYQQLNAGTAYLAARQLAGRFGLREATIREALRTVDWGARWQVHPLGDGRDLIIDVTHNAEGAYWLERNLLDLRRRRQGRRPAIIAGVLGAARAAALIPVAANYAAELFLVPPQQPRATPVEVLRSFLPAPDPERPVRTATVAELFPAAGVCRAGLPDRDVVVTGSIYLAGEVLERFLLPAPVHQGMLQD
ncbi:MAG: bifunctional folylpolyglutamate synthase/dihydrofolate synthase [Puniceicoccaceae bacterium]|nr:MAG: bifunctional folylpolyglutamate synthase/dihydrofolate synthase [Puniceicoccaceae bacterium]